MPTSFLRVVAQLVVFAIAVFGERVPHADAQSDEGSNCTPSFQSDVSSDSGPTPWTSNAFLNAPMNFQFAVVGDRTGGADARGVFARAVEQLNLLRPEFVINVGDAVEGYVDDSTEIHAMWAEFDEIIDDLDMPFFRTVGNHDMSNEAMLEVWRERYGPTWYHFVYGDVLFVALNTEANIRAAPEGMDDQIKLYNRLQVEDPVKAREMLEEFMKDEAIVAALAQSVDFGEEQTRWLEAVLEDNQDARWTFLFLHEPVWENPSDSFIRMESMLSDRDYTFIAGHLHYYDFQIREGRDHITMGPAGASFHHEGPGNVDHLLWISMTPDGPEICKVTLDGIFDRQGRDLQFSELYERKGWD